MLGLFEKGDHGASIRCIEFFTLDTIEKIHRVMFKVKTQRAPVICRCFFIDVQLKF